VAWVLAGLAWSGSAGAVVPNETVSTSAEPPPAEITPWMVPRREDYSFMLGTTYVLAPVLALAVGGVLSKLEVDDTVAVLGGMSMFVLPAVVHIAHGNNPHGALSFFSLAGVTGLGILAGGITGYIISSSSCSDHDSEECDLAGLPGLIVGSLVGGVVGYTAYAVYDVSSNASVVRRVPPPDPEASLQFWFSPMPARRGVASGSSSTWEGLQFGATLRM
jgi:hypothetical protein